MQPKTVNPNFSGPSSSSELNKGMVVLSKSDFDNMLSVLENPPEPSEALLKMVAIYNKATA